MINEKNIKLVILADDDEDDRLLFKEAFAESGVPCALTCVEDGVKLLDLLHKINQTNGESAASSVDFPGLILLDINMPRKNGKQVLKEIKENSLLKHIPVVMFSTSKSPDDVALTYQLGANSYIVKPATFEGLLEVTQVIRKYWVETASVKSVVSY